jgi:hypothetical protein
MVMMDIEGTQYNDAHPDVVREVIFQAYSAQLKDPALTIAPTHFSREKIERPDFAQPDGGDVVVYTLLSVLGQSRTLAWIFQQNNQIGLYLNVDDINDNNIAINLVIAFHRMRESGLPSKQN